MPDPRGIRTLLIANRGEIACRIIRTARAMGIRTVAVFSDPDRLAPHVLQADVAVPLGGVTATETYLDRAGLLKAAEWQGADAIHPGYGFLSESAAFARAVLNAGHIWVGPPPEAIGSMGDKVLAKQVAIDAGVPTLASSVLSGDDPRQWPAEAKAVGYPLLVKASAGGGGKGMRLVESADDLSDAVRTSQREAQASFGDRTVFVERWLPSPRHIEIQIFADSFGNIVHLGERECSIQRRHQKIIEESPSPVVDPALRARLGEAAVALAASINYIGAGTVEFLLEDADGDDPSFSFLEMNTRLQVEHPVTEAVCGLDLVRLQLRVAMGEALGFHQEDVRLDGHAIEARLYAEDPANGWLPSVGRLHRWQPGTTPEVRYDAGVDTGSIITPHYDPMLAKVITHAPTRQEAAARLTRALREMHIHGVATNRDYLVDILGTDDFAAGETRTDFVDRHPPDRDVGAGATTGADTSTTSYERQWHRFNTVLGPHLAAAALFPQRPAGWNSPANPWPFARSGWRNLTGRGKEMRPGGAVWRLADSHLGSAPQSVGFIVDGAEWEVEYARVSRDHPLALRRRAETGGRAPVELFNVAINGPAGHSTTLVEVIDLENEGPQAEVGEPGAPGDPSTGLLLVHFGRRGHHCSVHAIEGRIYVNSPLGQSELIEVPRFPTATSVAASGGPVSPVPGRVVSIEVQPGDDVRSGQALVVLEAMKVEHTVTAPAAGVVLEVLVRPGDNVDAHELLVRVEDAPPAEESSTAHEP
ncbi:MAG: ATP-grasp domain-containing protein [Actinobacteria bacterium]|nr:ATP-grasp domain-containing protein [Actinomycetota bacterium]